MNIYHLVIPILALASTTAAQTVAETAAPGVKVEVKKQQPALVHVTSAKRDSIVVDTLLVHEDVAPAPSTGFTNLTVRHSRIKLMVWDNAAEDGDVVSVFLNGTPVVQSLEIFHRPQIFSLTLQPGHNRLEIEANNEGLVPPNTASVAIIPEGEQGIEQTFIAHQGTRKHLTVTLE